MNTDFRRIHLDGAANSDGTIVQGMDREQMVYIRPGLRLPFETYIRSDVAVAYEPRLPDPLPPGVTADEILAEIRAGVAVATGKDVEWKTG